MAASMVVENEVTDPEGFREYQKRVGSTLESYGETLSEIARTLFDFCQIISQNHRFLILRTYPNGKYNYRV